MTSVEKKETCRSAMRSMRFKKVENEGVIPRTLSKFFCQIRISNWVEICGCKNTLFYWLEWNVQKWSLLLRYFRFWNFDACLLLRWRGQQFLILHQASFLLRQKIVASMLPRNEKKDCTKNAPDMSLQEFNYLSLFRLYFKQKREFQTRRESSKGTKRKPFSPSKFFLSRSTTYCNYRVFEHISRMLKSMFPSLTLHDHRKKWKIED